jgi:hypothetical protein
MSIDVEHEVAEFTRNQWPHWPICPVVDRSYRIEGAPIKPAGLPGAGYIMWRDDLPTGPVTIYLTNIWQIGEVAQKWEAEHPGEKATYANVGAMSEKIEFESLTKMVEAGWLAD